MRLSELWQKTSEAEKFSMAMKTAKQPDTRKISFHELPRTVQHAYLARQPYESIDDVLVLPPSRGRRTIEYPIYIVRDGDGIEHGFLEDGTEPPEPDDLDWYD